jgi:hypothetical protein
MKASISLLLLLALSAAPPAAWGGEPPAQDVAPPGPAAASPNGEDLPYGAGYEARLRQAAERERSQQASEVQRPATPTRDAAARAPGTRADRPVSRATDRPSDTRPARPERRR